MNFDQTVKNVLAEFPGAKLIYAGFASGKKPSQMSAENFDRFDLKFLAEKNTILWVNEKGIYQRNDDAEFFGLIPEQSSTISLSDSLDAVRPRIEEGFEVMRLRYVIQREQRLPAFSFENDESRLVVDINGEIREETREPSNSAARAKITVTANDCYLVCKKCEGIACGEDSAGMKFVSAKDFVVKPGKTNSIEWKQPYGGRGVEGKFWLDDSQRGKAEIVEIYFHSAYWGWEDNSFHAINKSAKEYKLNVTAGGNTSGAGPLGDCSLIIEKKFS